MKSSTIKKTLLLDQDNIRKAMRLYDAPTETEAVNKALAMAAEESELIAVHLEVAGKADISKAFK